MGLGSADPSGGGGRGRRARHFVGRALRLDARLARGQRRDRRRPARQRRGAHVALHDLRHTERQPEQRCRPERNGANPLAALRPEGLRAEVGDALEDGHVVGPERERPIEVGRGARDDTGPLLPLAAVDEARHELRDHALLVGVLVVEEVDQVAAWITDPERVQLGADLGGELRRGGGALVDVLGQGPGEGLRPASSDHRALGVGGLVLALEDAAQHLGGVFPLERQVPDDALVEQHPEREHVGVGTDLSPFDLLGGHVGRRTEDLTGGRHALGVEHLGDPEIGELHDHLAFARRHARPLPRGIRFADRRHRALGR